jgi:pilus assembly protein CpaB
MNRRGIVVLGLAVVCGLGTMFGVKRVLSTRSTAAVKTVNVLVAKQEIAVEQTLTDEMMIVKAVPAELVPPGVLVQLKDARGRWARIRLLPGDPILDGKLAPKGSPTGLIGKITPGMRAVTIRVDEQSGLSGFILPDYRVDVLQPKRSNADSSVSAVRLLLQNIRVLASGTVIESPEGRSIKSETVTLEVTPAEAEIVTAAAHAGPLSLSLRPLGDASIRELPIEPDPSPIAAPPPLAPRVPIELASERVRSVPRAQTTPMSRVIVFRGRRKLEIIGGSSARRGDTEDDEAAVASPNLASLVTPSELRPLPTRPPGQ